MVVYSECFPLLARQGVLGTSRGSTPRHAQMVRDLGFATVAYPECARGGGVSHIFAKKRCVSFTLFKKMHENAIFSPKRGGQRRLHPMLDQPLCYEIILMIKHCGLLHSSAILASDSSQSNNR